MGTEEIMGAEKVRTSAKFILKEDFLAEAMKKVGSMFTTKDEKSEDRFIDRLFEKLKHPIPVELKNGKFSVFVIDFLVK